MNIQVYYKNYTKIYYLDTNINIGFIQSDLLNLFSIFIYNIEYIQIIVNNNTFILGYGKFHFNENLEKVLFEIFKKKVFMQKIIIIHKKNNYNYNTILNEYNKWLNNNNITKYPINSILKNILQIPQIDNNVIGLNNILEDNLEEDILEEENNDLKLKNYINNLLDKDNILNNVLNNVLNNTLMNDALMNDNYEINDTPNIYGFDIFNEEFYENLFTIEGLEENHDKLNILDKTNFKNIESIVYLNNIENTIKICSICRDDFKNLDNLKKLECNHIFHSDCLEYWLCNKNNNCPICRQKVEKNDL
jgi:hypothetical protein